MSPGERERRGIQPRNTAARNASDGAAARRQIGQNMIERRSGKQQVDDINSFVTAPRQNRSLKTIEPRGAFLGQTGVGTYTPPPAGAGGGLASPLTEKTKADGKADREYHPDESVFYSNDYMLAVVVQPLKTLNMLDADGNEAVLSFAVPGATG